MSYQRPGSRERPIVIADTSSSSSSAADTDEGKHDTISRPVSDTDEGKHDTISRPVSPAHQPVRPPRPYPYTDEGRHDTISRPMPPPQVPPRPSPPRQILPQPPRLHPYKLIDATTSLIDRRSSPVSSSSSTFSSYSSSQSSLNPFPFVSPLDPQPIRPRPSPPQQVIPRPPPPQPIRFTPPPPQPVRFTPPPPPQPVLPRPSQPPSFGYSNPPLYTSSSSSSGYLPPLTPPARLPFYSPPPSFIQQSSSSSSQQQRQQQQQKPMHFEDMIVAEEAEAARLRQTPSPVSPPPPSSSSSAPGPLLAKLMATFSRLAATPPQAAAEAAPLRPSLKRTARYKGSYAGADTVEEGSETQKKRLERIRRSERATGAIIAATKRPSYILVDEKGRSITDMDAFKGMVGQFNCICNTYRPSALHRISTTTDYYGISVIPPFVCTCDRLRVPLSTCDEYACHNAATSVVCYPRASWYGESIESNCSLGAQTHKCNNTDMLYLREGLNPIRLHIRSYGPLLGKGLESFGFIPSGRFIMQYVGYVFDSSELDDQVIEDQVAYRRTLSRMSEEERAAAPTQQHYIVAMRRNLYINARMLGNAARFINHSCDPNCEMVHKIVVGLPCIAIFAKKNIRPGEQLTFDYDFDRRGLHARNMACKCGAPNCRKFI